MELDNAQKLNKASSSDPGSIFLIAAEWLVNMHAVQLAEMVLSRELLAKGRQVKPHLLLAQLEIQKRDFSMASYHIQEALQVQKSDSQIWSTFGHLLFIQGKWEESKNAYETVLSLTDGLFFLYFI